VPRTADGAGVHELDIVGGHAGRIADEPAQGIIGRGRAPAARDHEQADPRLVELEELAIRGHVHAAMVFPAGNIAAPIVEG
jgi:hypothetical protein